MAKAKQWQLDDQLRRAVERNDLARASELIAQGANARANKIGEKQLLVLVEDAPMARLLVEAGADPCAVDHVGHRPGEGMKFTLQTLGAAFSGWFPGKEAAADYLEEQADIQANKQTLQVETPRVQMTAEEERARALARRR